MQTTAATILHLIGPDTAPERLDVLREILDAGEAVGHQHVAAVGGRPAAETVTVDHQIALPRTRARVALLPPPARIARIRADLWHFWSLGALRWIPAVCEAHPGAAVLVDVDSTAAALQCAPWSQAPRVLGCVASGETTHAALQSAGFRADHILRLDPRRHSGSGSRSERSVIRRRLDLQDQHQAVLVLPPVCKSTEAAGAVWAAMIVQKVHADVRVLLPGAGAEVSRILRLCEAVGQRFMVRSVGSAVGLDELLVAADLALLNAPGDVPVDALVRAMGALAPIVARKSALISSLLVDGESGWLFDSGRPHAIARRLVVALEAPQERAQLAKAAQKKAERLSDGSANVDRYAAMVRGLCASA